MAHPYESRRDHKVQKDRVSHILKEHRAHGGAAEAHPHARKDRKLLKELLADHPEGDAAKRRADRPHRASGGRVKPKANNVTVVVNSAPPAEPAMPPLAGPPMLPPGPPPGAPPMPPGPPAGPPPGAMAGLGPMPPRARGGRAYATGGAVKTAKPGPAWNEGRKNGTQVSHDPGKNDLKDLGRGKPITYATGGAVEAPKGSKGMGPKFSGGAGGGEARLEKAERYKRKH